MLDKHFTFHKHLSDTDQNCVYHGGRWTRCRQVSAIYHHFNQCKEHRNHITGVLNSEYTFIVILKLFCREFLLEITYKSTYLFIENQVNFRLCDNFLKKERSYTFLKKKINIVDSSLVFPQLLAYALTIQFFFSHYKSLRFFFNESNTIKLL